MISSYSDLGFGLLQEGCVAVDMEDHYTYVISFDGLRMCDIIIYQLSHCFDHGLYAVGLLFCDDVQCH